MSGKIEQRATIEKPVKHEVNINKAVEKEITTIETKTTTKAYTAEEKFAEMSLKNPALMAFKQQFSLDFA